MSGTGSSPETPHGGDRPLLRVIRGNATPEEIAVITAVLAAAAGSGDAPSAEKPRSDWSRPERLARRPFTPGPGAWWASSLGR